jgi:hypothetical protein
MKDELAEELLASVMAWQQEQVAEFTPRLQALAQLKYDDYELYQPGVKFIESLASWLVQFDDVDERREAMAFVLGRVIFISRAELDHAIEVAYRDAIRPILIKKAADALGLSRFAIQRIANSQKFRELRRKTLVLGLSDGSRLDRLRRASIDLSHEQFYLVPDVGAQTVKNMRQKLARALGEMGIPSQPLFEHVFLVDDFSGSGFTLLRREDGVIDGKLANTRTQLEVLRNAGVLAEQATVSVLLYLASEQAYTHVSRLLLEEGMDWRLDVVQRLPLSLRITESDPIGQLCERYFDEAIIDTHKGEKPVPLGFRDIGLPLVLYHNTPNNSVCLLWADTSDNIASDRRRALFPRYERHHQNRP